MKRANTDTPTFVRINRQVNFDGVVAAHKRKTRHFGIWILITTDKDVPIRPSPRSLLETAVCPQHQRPREKHLRATQVVMSKPDASSRKLKLPRDPQTKIDSRDEGCAHACVLYCVHTRTTAHAAFGLAGRLMTGCRATRAWCASLDAIRSTASRRCPTS